MSDYLVQSNRAEELREEDKAYHDWLLKADSELEVPCPLLAIGEPCRFGCEDSEDD